MKCNLKIKKFEKNKIINATRNIFQFNHIVNNIYFPLKQIYIEKSCGKMKNSF